MIRALTLLLILTAIAHAQTTVPSDDQIDAKLAETVLDVAYDGVSLGDALQDLAKKSGLNFVVKWNALEAEGVDRTAPVTLNLKQVRADQALRHLAGQAGGGVTQIEFIAYDGAIVVTTANDMSSFVDQRIYDLSDLLIRLRPEHPPGETASPDEFIFESLVQTIQEIEGDTWKDNGGVIGTIRMVGSNLVVNQTRSTHRQIAALLDDLRQSPAVNVRISAHILLLTDDDLPAELRNNAAAPPLLLDDRQLQALLETARRPGRERLVASGQTLVASGRSVVLFDDTEAPAAARGERYRCRLELAAAAAKDQASIAVAAFPELTAMTAAAGRPTPPRRQVQTAVEIPVGKTLLLRGLVRPGEPGMIVLITPTIEPPPQR